MAVRHDALDANPVRELNRSRKKKPPRAIELTEESLVALREHLCVSPDGSDLTKARGKRGVDLKQCFPQAC